MDQQARSVSSADSGFALLRLDETHLMVPRDDIRVVELSIDLDSSQPPSCGVGWIKFGQQRCPAYCWSGGMEWSDVILPDRPICAVLAADGQYFGLLCSEAALLGNDKLAMHDVPPSMLVPALPFNRLAMHGEAVACVSSAREILADILGAKASRDTLPVEVS